MDGKSNFTLEGSRVENRTPCLLNLLSDYLPFVLSLRKIERSAVYAGLIPNNLIKHCSTLSFALSIHFSPCHLCASLLQP